MKGQIEALEAKIAEQVGAYKSREAQGEEPVAVAVEVLAQKLKGVDLSTPRSHSNPWTGEGRDCYEPAQEASFKMPQVG